MIRRLFTVASALSLVMCVAAIALLVRSYNFYDAGPFPPNGALLQLDSLNGEVALTWHTHPSYAHRPTDVFGANTEFTRELHYRQLLSFDLEEWWENEGCPRWLHVSTSEPPPARWPFGNLGHLENVDLARTTSGSRFVRTDLAFKPSKSSAVIMSFYTVVMPYWLMGGLLAVLPIIRFLPVNRFVGWCHARKRTARGRCRQCGYDLRASKERCPECGAPIPIKLNYLS